MESQLELLRKDFDRFSKLHSWYKHLDIGIPYYTWLEKGIQECGERRKEVDDEEMHWHFHKSPLPPETTIPFYCITFGPFLRGVERGRIAYGGRKIYESPDFPELIQKYYPEWIDVNWKDEFEVYPSPIKNELFHKEKERYWNEMVDIIFPKSDFLVK